jgi:hypothetical protein
MSKAAKNGKTEAPKEARSEVATLEGVVCLPALVGLLYGLVTQPHLDVAELTD